MCVPSSRQHAHSDAEPHYQRLPNAAVPKYRCNRRRSSGSAPRWIDPDLPVAMQPTRSTSRCRCAGATFLALALLPDLAAAHGLLTCPSPRQNRGSPMTGNEWTNWMGAAGNGYAPGYGNAQSLNGGGRKLAHALPGTRDLCGGTLANHFSAGGPYGPTDVSALPDQARCHAPARSALRLTRI